MKRLRILAVTMLMAALSGSAAGLRSMVIETTDGEGMTVNLSSELTTNFSDGNMIIRGDYVDITVALSTVKGWIYSDTVTNRVEVAEAEEMTLTNEGDRIVITGIPAGSEVALYSMGGQMLRSDNSAGEYTLMLSDLANGVYVLSVNSQSFKIAVNR